MKESALVARIVKCLPCSSRGTTIQAEDDRAAAFRGLWMGEEVHSEYDDMLACFSAYCGFIRHNFWRPILLWHHALSVEPGHGCGGSGDYDYHLLVLIQTLPTEEVFWTAGCALRRLLPKDIVTVILRFCEEPLLLHWDTNVCSCYNEEQVEESPRRIYCLDNDRALMLLKDSF